MKIPSPRSPIPRLAQETVRQAMAVLLTENPLSAHEISAELRVSEKEVYGHLEHLRRSLHSTGDALEITPAECRKCGYIFAKRNRLSPPGKCPACRHQGIADPQFGVRRRQQE